MIVDVLAFHDLTTVGSLDELDQPGGVPGCRYRLEDGTDALYAFDSKSRGLEAACRFNKYGKDFRGERYAAMPILILHAPRSMDPAVLRTLFSRGYQVTTTETASEALELIHQAQFDCILIDIATSASGDYGGLAEIRQFVRTSPVGLMTAAPVESLIREAFAEGSIERISVPVLSATIEHLSQPVLLVGARLHPGLIQAIRSKGLLFSNGTTLQFAMNLLVDGWCQIVLLTAAIAGITEPDELVIFHQVKAKQLAILAAALPDTLSAIICIKKPQKAGDYIALFEQIARNRTSHRGLAQGFGKRHRQNL